MISCASNRYCTSISAWYSRCCHQASRKNTIALLAWCSNFSRLLWTASSPCEKFPNFKNTGIPEPQEHWYADIAWFSEMHGEPLVLVCDNASANISTCTIQFRENLGICTSCPHESNKNGLTWTHKSVLLASGLDKGSGIMPSWSCMPPTHYLQVQYSRVTKLWPQLLING